MSFHSTPTTQDPQREAGGYGAHTTSHENPAWLEALHLRLQQEHGPVGPTESHLVWALAMAIWRAERAGRLERAALRDDASPIELGLSISYTVAQQAMVSRALHDLLAIKASSPRPPPCVRWTACGPAFLVDQPDLTAANRNEAPASRTDQQRR